MSVELGATAPGGRALTEPSAWVERFAGLLPAGGPVLDLACGGGRHTELFLSRGHAVTAIDRDLGGLGDLAEDSGVEAIQANLEAEPDDSSEVFTGAGPLAGRTFAGVVVTNYLWRPLLPFLVAAVAPGGVLIYETFAAGNERFGRPTNPDFLLRPGELLDAVAGDLRVVAYEDLIVDHPKPAAVQRIAARREPEPLES